MKTTENVAALIGSPKFYILGCVEVENPRDNYLSFDHQYTGEVFTSLDSAKKTAQDILCDYDHATMCIDEYSTEGIENYESIQDFIDDSDVESFSTEEHITVRLEFKDYNGNMTVYVKDGHDRYNFEIHYSGDNLFPEEYQNYEEAMAGHENHFRDMIKDHLIDNSTNTDTVANDDIDYIISTIRTSISPIISNYFDAPTLKELLVNVKNISSVGSSAIIIDGEIYEDYEVTDLREILDILNSKGEKYQLTYRWQDGNESNEPEYSDGQEEWNIDILNHDKN